MRLMTIANVLMLFVSRTALAQDESGHPICYHKVRHVDCHFGSGRMKVDTDPSKYFSNSPPALVFFEPDGTFHAVIGNCDVTCRP